MTFDILTNWLNCVGLVKLFDYHHYLPSDTYDASDETFITMLVDDVNHSQSTIRIVECPENMYLYDDARVVDSFERAVARGVKIQFVLKPEVGVIE